MATVIQLEAETIAALDAVVASGRFPTRDVAILTALHIAEEVDATDRAPLSPEEIAGIERGLADVAAGRVFTSEEVRVELERRHIARR